MKDMRVIVMSIVLAGCANTAACPDSESVARACPAVPAFSGTPTASALAAYAQRIVDLYGQCAAAQTQQSSSTPAK